MTEARVCGECESRVGITVQRLRTGREVTATQWLWAPAAGEAGHVFVDTSRTTVHPDPRERHTVVRARPGALPLSGRSVPALVVGPILPDLADLDGLFAEFRRVLRPHGLLTMLVPDGLPLGLRARGLRRSVRASWTHPSAVEHPDWLLTAADFAVMSDDRVVFRDAEQVTDPHTHVDALRDAGLLPSALPVELRDELASHADGRVALRRLVARR